MTVAVVTDSSATLPADLVSRWGITVVPLQVVVDGSPRAEGVEISSAEVLAALVAGQEVATSQPSVETFAATFRRLADDGATSIVAVLLSSRLSGTVAGARQAADAVAIPVTVVDSAQVAMATGFAALAAASAASAGLGPQECAERARQVAATATCTFTVDTLEFLRRGGRLSSAAAAMGRMLQVRPVLDIVGGEVAVAEKVRSTARAREAVTRRALDAAQACTNPVFAVLTLGGDYGDQCVAELPAGATVVRADVGAVLAVHAGPGALAIATADLSLPPT
ncbi:DegV family protein [Demequina sp. NBRC 110057]|uniref:DegV family protein n=1 Tax=Demequina sp. NBRC 110057 TaxID=1570346 RepID=UPI000A000427|nr:DegV family protein [Demequina sp. NBRC 110057]